MSNQERKLSQDLFKLDCSNELCCGDCFEHRFLNHDEFIAAVRDLEAQLEESAKMHSDDLTRVDYYRTQLEQVTKERDAALAAAQAIAELKAAKAKVERK
jgi:alkylhydroperoxidase family enzyme